MSLAKTLSTKQSFLSPSSSILCVLDSEAVASEYETPAGSGDFAVNQLAAFIVLLDDSFAYIAHFLRVPSVLGPIKITLAMTCAFAMRFARLSSSFDEEFSSRCDSMTFTLSSPVVTVVLVENIRNAHLSLSCATLPAVIQSTKHKLEESSCNEISCTCSNFASLKHCAGSGNQQRSAFVPTFASSVCLVVLIPSLCCCPLSSVPFVDEGLMDLYTFVVPCVHTLAVQFFCTSTDIGTKSPETKPPPYETV
mmetsp:Transcript_8653/g.25306  ORF Transcript_8653/g.25306 Transcript_8653/m.25306 type:complete len:251 (-) Transcript_8653:2078-2830(-)